MNSLLKVFILISVLTCSLSRNLKTPILEDELNTVKIEEIAVEEPFDGTFSYNNLTTSIFTCDKFDLKANCEKIMMPVCAYHEECESSDLICWRTYNNACSACSEGATLYENGECSDADDLEVNNFNDQETLEYLVDPIPDDFINNEGIFVDPEVIDEEDMLYNSTNTNTDYYQVFCEDADREVTECTEEYRGVCGFKDLSECEDNCEVTYSTICFACMNKDIVYVVDGECNNNEVIETDEEEIIDNNSIDFINTRSVYAYKNITDNHVVIDSFSNSGYKQSDNATIQVNNFNNSEYNLKNYTSNYNITIQSLYYNATNNAINGSRFFNNYNFTKNSNITPNSTMNMNNTGNIAVDYINLNRTNYYKPQVYNAYKNINKTVNYTFKDEGILHVDKEFLKQYANLTNSINKIYNNSKLNNTELAYTSYISKNSSNIVFDVLDLYENQPMKKNFSDYLIDSKPTASYSSLTNYTNITVDQAFEDIVDQAFYEDMYTDYFVDDLNNEEREYDGLKENDININIELNYNNTEYADDIINEIYAELDELKANVYKYDIEYSNNTNNTNYGN